MADMGHRKLHWNFSNRKKLLFRSSMRTMLLKQMVNHRLLDTVFITLRARSH